MEGLQGDALDRMGGAANVAPEGGVQRGDRTVLSRQSSGSCPRRVEAVLGPGAPGWSLASQEARSGELRNPGESGNRRRLARGGLAFSMSSSSLRRVLFNPTWSIIAPGRTARP